MSFIRTDLAGQAVSPETNKPIVVNAGIPGFRIEMPVTTPAREKVLALAAIGAGTVGFFALAGLVLFATRKK